MPLRIGRVGAGLVGAAVAVRVLVLPVAPVARAVDIAMVVLTAVVGLIVVRLPSRFESRRHLVTAAATVALAVIAAVALHVAAGVLPDFTMIAVAVFAAVLVGIETEESPELPLVAGAAVIAIFAVLWVTSTPAGTGLPSFLVAVALLAGIRLLTLGGAERTREHIDAETQRGHVYATLGRRLGVARDVPSVASAVLEACLETFPETSSGLVLMNDAADGLLKGPGVYLSANGVATGGPAYELAPGEGLGGAAFASAQALLWPTTLSASMAQASLREANRVRLRRSKLGFIRSAIGAPLQVDGSTIGVILLTSERRENVWSETDLPLMTALADEAAKALERARRYEEEMSRALLDSVTGLPTRSHVMHVIDKELARASRSEATLAVIIADVDDFKVINDRWGHDAGNLVLESFAQVLRSILRREDSAARFGADEFVCVLPGADRDQARVIAGRVQQRFTAETESDHVAGRSGVTASCGVAVYPADSQDVEGLIAAASAELEIAKQSRHLTGRVRLRGRVKDTTAS
jgi:diguanylate cyclase (GGDEF)-like protein